MTLREHWALWCWILPVPTWGMCRRGVERMRRWGRMILSRYQRAYDLDTCDGCGRRFSSCLAGSCLSSREFLCPTCAGVRKIATVMGAPVLGKMLTSRRMSWTGGTRIARRSWQDDPHD